MLSHEFSIPLFLDTTVTDGPQLNILSSISPVPEVEISFGLPVQNPGPCAQGHQVIQGQDFYQNEQGISIDLRTRRFIQFGLCIQYNNC
jgi:hypothetical protein